MGWASFIGALYSSGSPATASVAIVPGATALTRMPRSAHSTARCLVIPEATNFAGPYVDCCACPATPEMDERQTIEPPGSACSSIASTAYLQVRNIPRPSIAMTRSQSSGVASTMLLSGMTPALATRTSIRPNLPTAASMMRRASSTTETSPTTASTSAPGSANRSRRPSSPSPSTSLTTSLAPSLANNSAVARPMPFAAPVTTADLPRSLPNPRFPSPPTSAKLPPSATRTRKEPQARYRIKIALPRASR